MLNGWYDHRRYCECQGFFELLQLFSDFLPRDKNCSIYPTNHIYQDIIKYYHNVKLFRDSINDSSYLEDFERVAESGFCQETSLQRFVINSVFTDK